MDEVALHGSSAAIVVPVLEPGDLNLVLDVRSPEALSVRLAMNGRPLGDVTAGPEPSRQRLQVPAHALFRGDNCLTLERFREAKAAIGLFVLNLRQVKS